MKPLPEAWFLKLKLVFLQLKVGVKGVVIIDGRKPHAVLYELCSSEGAVTLIVEWLN